MKSLISQVLYFTRQRSSRVNLVTIARFVLLIVSLVAVYTILFHVIMEYEGRSESWITGIYWTLTVMSTLGFGDITFQSDLGRLFSSVVLLTGVFFLLILLPFTFIEFFYEPWMKAQRALRAPTRLPEKTRGHVIITHVDAVTRTLIEKLKQYEYPYVIIVQDLNEALNLHDLDYQVMLGDLDTPKTYQLARVDQALLVVSTATDQINTNVAATVREVTETVPIIATASVAASVDILQFAGCSSVLQLGEMMGQMLARRVSDGESMAHVIGQFDDLQIAEAIVRNTSLVGSTLRQSQLRAQTGINVMGMWTRGEFQVAGPDTPIHADTTLIMAGTVQQIDNYNEMFKYACPIMAPILIIGGGRVGKATGKALAERGIDYRIVEKNPERIRNAENYVLGDAADLEILEQAGIRTTPTVIITTHDDDMNIYLTIYCRRLHPDTQIIARAGMERNVATLHRVGADFVLSYASTGTNAIINTIGRDNILMVSEGLDVFEVEMPAGLVGKSIAESHIRRKTGATVIALRQNDKLQVSLDPHRPLPHDAKILLIGTPEAEKKFLELY